MDYCQRLQRLKQRLVTLPADALIVEHPTDLLYLTGIEMSAGKLYVGLQEAVLVVDGRYFETCARQAPLPVYLMDEMPLKQWLAKNHIHYLAFESEKTTYERYQQLTQEAVHLQPVSSLVQQLRLIKDADEIMLLEQAAHLGYQGYEYTLSLLKNGISEAELAFELELFWRRRGAKKLAFETIIAFGVNASMPHYRAGETRFIPQMPVLIDSGVIWHHYHSDMTRVILPQEPSMELKTMYKAVAEAKQAALSACQPGCLIGDLDKIARHILKTYNYESYFTHSLGHGIGLDIHEPPTIRSIGKYASLELQTGMVITIEPGVYIPSVGGVRLEDTILITETGFKNFYNFNKT